MVMVQTLRGRVRGYTIELDDNHGLADGQTVEVSVRVVSDSTSANVGSGILRTEGALADDPHWDGIMEEIHNAQSQERRVAADDQ
jgi:hypothetical protein